MPDVYNNKIVLTNEDGTPGEVLMDLTADSVDAEHMLQGYTAHDRSGAPITGQCTFDADTSDATADATKILTGYSAYVNGTKLDGTMANRNGIEGNITTKAQEYGILAGYHDGSGIVKIHDDEQAKIISGNIKQGVTILGVEGSYGGEPVSIQPNKNATPGWSQQQITPDSGYDYLAQVTVAAIPLTRTLNAQGGYTVSIGPSSN